jgi:hypothetical protein
MEDAPKQPEKEQETPKNPVFKLPETLEDAHAKIRELQDEVARLRAVVKKQDR